MYTVTNIAKFEFDLHKCIAHFIDVTVIVIRRGLFIPERKSSETHIQRRHQLELLETIYIAPTCQGLNTGVREVRLIANITGCSRTLLRRRGSLARPTLCVGNNVG